MPAALCCRGWEQLKAVNQPIDEAQYQLTVILNDDRQGLLVSPGSPVAGRLEAFFGQRSAGDDRVVLSKQFMKRVQIDGGGGGGVLDSQRGRGPGSLAHGHARGLDAERGIGQSVARNAAACHQ